VGYSLNVRTRIAIGLLAAAFLLVVAVTARAGITRLALAGAGLATGYSIRAGDLQIGRTEAILSDVHVARRGEPLLDAARIGLTYDLRDLLPGSRHRFGLRGIDIEQPTLTLVRHRDGSFNFNVPAGGGGARPPRHNPVPLRLTLRLRDGRIVLREPFAYDASARELRAVGLTMDGNIDTAAVTHYRLSGAFEERRREPFTVIGRVDAPAGYALHHARARDFPLRALANYFADTPEMRIRKATGRNFDARVYSIAEEPPQAASYHANLTLDVSDASLAMRVLAAPVEHLSGHLQVVDDAFFVRGASAMLGGIPLRIDGGAYDFTGGLTGQPQLRLGVEGSGDLSGLRQAFAFARDQPISGRAHLGVLVAGPISNPVIVARVGAPHAAYRAMPFDDLRARVVYNSNVVALAPLQADYGGVNLSLRGTLGLGPVTRSEFALHVRAPASRLEYLNELLGDEPIVVDAALTGQDLRFDVNGSAASLRGTERVGALVAMHPNGTAAVAPFWLHTQRGRLDGGYVLDRPDDTSAFWIAGQRLQLHAPTAPTFAGLSLPSMPPIDGRNVNVALAGGGSGRHTVLAGTIGTGIATIAGVPMYRVSASLEGSLRTLATNEVVAAGPWGDFGGNGEFSPRGFAAYGAYRGTLEGLQPYLGSAITGHGALNGTVGIAIEPARIVVSGVNLAMEGASLRGVPITRADLTLAVEGSVLRLLSARARAAGGEVVAAGSFSLAGARYNSAAERLNLVASALQASQLRGIGLPLTGGTLNATGALAAGAPLPRFEGAVSIQRSRLDRFALSGNGDVALGGNAVTLSRTLGALGGTYTEVNGAIGDLMSGSPAYALDADVPAAAVAPTLHSFGISRFGNYPLDGTFNARLRIEGRGARPAIGGDVAVPGGELNGLPFINGSARLAADPAGVTISNGGVLVGTTAARFTADARPNDNAVRFDAARANLSDFNNFFDTGETLAGYGKIRLLAAGRANEISSSGDVDVRGFRYRNLPIGDTRAVWTSSHNTIRGTLAVGGSEGRLRAGGSISLPGLAASDLTRARFDLSAAVKNLDLALWLPALGMQQVPITGRASGSATLHGRFPALDVRGNASISDGTLGSLTLERADLAVHAARRRMIVDRAEMVTPELTASATGSLGLEKNQPLDVRVHAQTEHLATLAYRFTRRRVPVSGFFESTLDIGGTYKSPSFSAGFDANDVRLYGVAIASVFGELRLKGRSLVLSNAGATFARGDVTLAGSLPLTLSPFGLGAAREPLNFDLDLVGVDPAVFDAVFGNGTHLGGIVDGHVGLSGTIGRPLIVGRLALSHGAYASDLERVPITAIAAALSFNHASATLSRATARLGNGSLTLSGAMQFPKGFSAEGLSLRASGIARGAQLDLPAYGAGTLDAKVAVAKAPTSAAVLSGGVTLSNAALPFSAFLKAAGQSSAGAAALPLAFDLNATAGRNVRVRGNGYGAGLDIGATGSVHLGGTLAAPTLSGTIGSTGGTLTYFDRAFRVQQGTVEFTPSDGIVPTLRAVATTNVVNPDPDRARNPYGSADITITVNGQISALKIDLTSNPAGYSRDEILGLIAPFGGFLNGIAFSRQSMLARQQPGGFAPLGALSPIPEVNLEQRNTITVGQEAFNLLNAQFTAGLLAPVESALGAGLGLTSVNLTLGYYGNVGVTATRLLGKTVSLIYAVTFGVPQVQSFGIMLQPNEETSARLNFFYQSGPTKLLQLPNSPVGYNAGYVIAQPLIGNSGFSLSLQRYFW